MVQSCYFSENNPFFSLQHLSEFAAVASGSTPRSVVYLATAGITDLRQRGQVTRSGSKTAQVRSKIVLQAATQVVGGDVSLLKPPPTVLFGYFGTNLCSETSCPDHMFLSSWFVHDQIFALFHQNYRLF